MCYQFMYASVIQHAQDSSGSYAWDYTGAVNWCAARGMTIATQTQYTDWFYNANPACCAYGWIEGPTQAIPLQTSSYNCGQAGPNIGIWTGSADAYCVPDYSKCCSKMGKYNVLPYKILKYVYH